MGHSSSDSDSDSSDCEWEAERPQKPKIIELKYDGVKSTADDDYTEIIPTNYVPRKYGLLTVKSSYWKIDNFSESDAFTEKGFLRSKAYRAGNYNEFQFYYVMLKQEIDKKIHFGVYCCILNDTQSEPSIDSIHFNSYLIDDSNRRCELAYSRAKEFPKKPGFIFIGSMSKERIIDDEIWNFRCVPEDVLTLCIRMDVYYNEGVLQTDFLGKLLEENKEKDVTLIVKGQEFPANKAILKFRSSVFAKMLDENKTAEKLKINDVHPLVMKQLLMFMYTGYVTKLFLYTDEILAAADKYKLTTLKAMCQRVKAENDSSSDLLVDFSNLFSKSTSRAFSSSKTDRLK